MKPLDRQQAMPLTQENRYHAIFLDIGLPDVGGRDLRRSLWARTEQACMCRACTNYRFAFMEHSAAAYGRWMQGSA